MNPERRHLLERAAAWTAGLGTGVWGAACSVVTHPSSEQPAAGQPVPPAVLDTASSPPPLPREWRAAWVASVAHIDWPRQAGLPAGVLLQQIHDFVARAHAMGLNALILQVRPAADALYPSSLEPPSEYLHANGQPGESFDALQAWVQACHALGIELHAWFNPYRARHPSARQPIHEAHVARRQPDWVRRYGDMLWLDPGHPDAQAHSLNVIKDVVRRYDIDGVHVDDYFYPYPIKGADGKEVPFPDDETYARYRSAGGFDDRARWRRENVNRFVAEMYTQVHAIKSAVRVTISPFGIGRPDRRPAGIDGFSQYDQLHADVEHWCEQGWLDALLPQLYWPRSRPQQSFEALLDYWLATNPHRRHVWPGLYTSSVANGTPTAWAPEEVLWQIDRQRERKAASGHAHFSLQALLQDRGGLGAELPRSRYAQRALAPATPWLARDAAPSAARARRLPNGLVALHTEDGRTARQWAVWRRPADRTNAPWSLSVMPHDALVKPNGAPEWLVVHAMDSVGREGPASAFLLSA